MTYNFVAILTVYFNRLEHLITAECHAVLLNGVMLKGLNGHLKLVSDHRSLENSPLDIFV